MGLVDDAQMTPQEVEHMAKKLRLKLYRTCVKDNLNIDEVFQHLGEQFVFRGGEAALCASAVTLIQDMAKTPVCASTSIMAALLPSKAAPGAQAAAVGGPQDKLSGGGGAKKPL